MRAEVTLVGRPFKSMGMGERLRTTFRALMSAGVDVRVRDVDETAGNSEFPTADEIRERLVDRLDSQFTIVIINEDEPRLAFRRLESESEGGYRIVYPAWESARDPESWARELERYQEVWAASSFAAASFRCSVHRPVKVLPLPCQPILTQRYSRRHFGISESAYVFVFFFDLSSHLERKNPFALLDAVANVREARPYAEFQVVLKVGSPRVDAAAWARFIEAVEPHRRHVVLVDRVLSDDELNSLVSAGDALISLHRAEDFGFGAGEAMYFGKPVVATGFSGNMEYMTPDTALLVDYKLIPALEGPNPQVAGQEWADPDLAQAAEHMVRLLDDPEAGRALGARASARIRTHFSHRACGLRYAARLAEIPR